MQKGTPALHSGKETSQRMNPPMIKGGGRKAALFFHFKEEKRSSIQTIYIEKEALPEKIYIRGRGRRRRFIGS